MHENRAFIFGEDSLGHGDLQRIHCAPVKHIGRVFHMDDVIGDLYDYRNEASSDELNELVTHCDTAKERVLTFDVFFFGWRRTNKTMDQRPLACLNSNEPLKAEVIPEGVELHRLTSGRRPPLVWFYFSKAALHEIVMWKIFDGVLLDPKKQWRIETWTTHKPLKLLDIREVNEDILGKLMDKSACEDYKHIIDASGLPDNYNLATSVCRHLGPGWHGWLSHAPWMLSEHPEVMVCPQGHHVISLTGTQTVEEYLNIPTGDLPNFVEWIQTQFKRRDRE